MSADHPWLWVSPVQKKECPDCWRPPLKRLKFALKCKALTQNLWTERISFYLDGWLGPQDRSMPTSIRNIVPRAGKERHEDVWPSLWVQFPMAEVWLKVFGLKEHKWRIVYVVYQGQVSPRGKIRKKSCFCKIETPPSIEGYPRKRCIKSRVDYLGYPLGPWSWYKPHGEHISSCQRVAKEWCHQEDQKCDLWTVL